MTYRRLTLAIAAAVALSLVASTARAQPMKIGQRANIQGFMCATQDEAIKLAKAAQTRSAEEMAPVLAAVEACAQITVPQALVKRLVGVYPGNDGIATYVLELVGTHPIDGSKVSVFVLTDEAPVDVVSL
jgi:hypothetical protein